MADQAPNAQGRHQAGWAASTDRETRLWKTQRTVHNLAVQLCGTLSVKAVEMFNLHENASDLVLKPCCLPGWNHTYTHDTWELGGHCIPVKDVCAKGKWKGNRWIGPPRSHLRHKFAERCVAPLQGHRRRRIREADGTDTHPGGGRTPEHVHVRGAREVFRGAGCAVGRVRRAKRVRRKNQ